MAHAARLLYRDSELRSCTDPSADDIHISTSLSNPACYFDWTEAPGDAEDMSCGVDRNMSGRSRERHDFPSMSYHRLESEMVSGKPALDSPISESSLRRTTPSSQARCKLSWSLRGWRLCCQTEKTCVGADPALNYLTPAGIEAAQEPGGLQQAQAPLGPSLHAKQSDSHETPWLGESKSCQALSSPRGVRALDPHAFHAMELCKNKWASVCTVKKRGARTELHRNFRVGGSR